MISSYLKLTLSGNLATALIITRRSIKTHRMGCRSVNYANNQAITLCNLEPATRSAL